ncbi:hypothetical protein PSACC_00530 [Paramicrosporidium saccamoebae]|uniref:Uncharacterized protein n=1 Tax=Paramicrosporidium saccamoebae TaxID=1246581 RepID=A0A2H9TPJ3_9FUNG|nr:hypothetical protein PSACC_00530 [Paramicrosporidium saccamoebae]
MLLWTALQLVSFVSGAKVLFQYRGNRLCSIGPKGSFKYFEGPGFTANDGELSVEGGCLVVNSYPFKQSRSDISDTTKFHLSTNRAFQYKTGKVIVQMTGSAIMHGVEDNPFGEGYALSRIDSRLATSVFGVRDACGQAFNFLIVNGEVSAMIHAPFSTSPGPTVTSTMSYNIPLVNTQAGEEHTLALIFDAAAQSVSWSVDGTIHYTWTVDSQIPQENCVLRWGDPNRFTYPRKFTVGFGNYAGLAYYPPVSAAKAFDVEYKGLVNLPSLPMLLNPQTGEPAEFITDSSEQKARVWDRGAVLRIRDIIVTHNDA